MRAAPTVLALSFLSLAIGAAIGASPASAQAPAGPWSLLDPLGDVQVAPYGIPIPASAGQSTPMTDEVDLRKLSIIRDDLEALEFQVEVADLQSVGTYTDPYPLEGYGLRLEYSLEGGTIRYSIRLNFNGAIRTSLPQEKPRLFSASHCLLLGGRELGCSRAGMDARVDYEKSLIHIQVPKSHLVANTPLGQRYVDAKAVLPPVERGSRLSDWRLTFQHNRAYWVPLTPVIVVINLIDTLTGQGANGNPYRLQTPVANQVVRLTSGANTTFPLGPGIPYSQGGTGGLVAADPGTPRPLMVRVQNTAATRRLVNLTATFAEAASGGDWKVRTPPTVEVPANSTRNVTLMVEGKPGLPHRARADLLLVATALGRTDEIGFFRISLVSAPAPTPERPAFQIHAAMRETAGGVCLPVEECAVPVLWMNQEEQDPAANAETGAGTDRALGGGAPSSFSVWTGQIRMDLPLTRDFTVAPREPAAVKLDFTARRELIATVSATLYLTNYGSDCLRPCSADLVLGRGSTSLVIGPSPSTAQFSIPILPSAQSKAIDGRVLRLGVEVGQLAPHQAGPNLLGVQLIPTESSLSLPWTTPSGLDGANGPLRLYPQNGTQEFVYPGRSRLMPVRLANEGERPERVRVDAVNLTNGWSARIQPGSLFQLGPGKSANLGVLVTSPANAAEGSWGNLTLEARPENGTALPSRLMLQLVATEGAANIPDEAGAFQADEDTLNHVLQEPKRKSPGAGALLVVAIWAAVLLRRRRRGPEDGLAKDVIS